MSTYGKGLKTLEQTCLKRNVRNHKDRLRNLGEMAIFVGYPDGHHFGTYSLFMKENKTIVPIVEKRDVVSLDISFHHYQN
jgi:hypothetical protein